jgi:RNA polymerase sigma-70 factor (ECF subfamily)
VFRLYAIEGYAHAEIATLLNMSEGTSKWHLSTARQRLRELLTQENALLSISKSNPFSKK